MKSKYFLYLLLMGLLLSGCSKEHWLAKMHMLKGENTFTKAYQLKTKKVPYEARVEYYKLACENFHTAYTYDPEIFTLTRIEEAMDACWKSNERDKEEIFKQFEVRYSKSHPKEYEYRDQGVVMELA
jgi:hypothetical protein